MAKPGRDLGVAYSPENLRLGKAIEAVRGRARWWVGTDEVGRPIGAAGPVRAVLGRIEWMSVESAEMTKHALNGFLATLGDVHQRAGPALRAGRRGRLGGRARPQERARIGPRAYVSPGPPSPAARWLGTSGS